MKDLFEATGGARIGSMNASIPFAKLTVTPQSLRISLTLFGDYRFTPEQVVSIAAYTRIPILGWGIRITHTVSTYPEQIVFWHLCKPARLLEGIHETGFQSEGSGEHVPLRDGSPVRTWLIWLSQIPGGLLLGYLLLHRSFVPFFFGTLFPYYFLCVWVGLLVVYRSPRIQQWLLKPGRQIEEIRPMLKFTVIVSSFVVPFFLILHFCGIVPKP